MLRLGKYWFLQQASDDAHQWFDNNNNVFLEGCVGARMVDDHRLRWNEKGENTLSVGGCRAILKKLIMTKQDYRDLNVKNHAKLCKFQQTSTSSLRRSILLRPRPMKKDARIYISLERVIIGYCGIVPKYILCKVLNLNNSEGCVLNK